MKIFTYHEPLEWYPDQTPLVDLWRESWSAQGFECIVLGPPADLNDRWIHSLATEWKDWLSRTNNAWNYTQACYRRWHMYASQGFSDQVLFCDYDVINRDICPEDIEWLPDRLWIAERDGVPCLGTGHRMTLGRLCRMFRNAAVLQQAGPHCVRDDLSDMNLIRDFADFAVGDLVGLPHIPTQSQARAMHFTNHCPYPEGRIKAAQDWYRKGILPC